MGKRATNKTEGENSCGPLSAYGMEEGWQAALLLPQSYEDMTVIAQSVSELDEKIPRPFSFRVIGAGSTAASRGVVRASFPIVDVAGGACRATIFGNAAQWVETLVPGQYTFMATAKAYRDELNPVLKEMVEPEWIGRIRPKYPALRSGVAQATVRKWVRKTLPGVLGKATRFVSQAVASVGEEERTLQALGCPGWTLDQILWQAHMPESMAYAEHARATYRYLAALAGYLRIHGEGPEQAAAPIHTPTLDVRIKGSRYTPTEEQESVVRDVAQTLASGKLLRYVLCGDVGTGKTLCASLLAAAVVDAGAHRRVLVMVPNTRLAAQFRDELHNACPDLACSLLTADAGEENPDARIVVGTSAVLFRDLGNFDLVIVDEQQRWSRAQREHYVAGHTHLLELSATCIPRTQALVQYGKVQVGIMRKTHKPKTIQTRLWRREDSRSLFKSLTDFVQGGEKLLVVYPKREAGGQDDQQEAKRGVDDRYSVERAVELWEKAFPGRVVGLTSADEEEIKQETLKDFGSGEKAILVATTVVEVGLNLPGLRRIMIVHPDRFGLTQLHQLRGRVARQGGEGWCELFAPETMSPTSEQRMEVFMGTTDGFKLAKADLKQRGGGDMSARSKEQSGADKTFLFGDGLDPDVLEVALKALEANGFQR